MKSSLFKKIFVILTIILLIGVNFIPIIGGNTLRLNSLDARKTEWNDKNFNSYNPKCDVKNLVTTEYSAYLIRDKFGSLHLSDVTDSITLHNNKNHVTSNNAPSIFGQNNYNCFNPDFDHYQNDDTQFLEFRSIEQQYKIINIEKLNNNIDSKSRVIYNKLNPIIYDKNLLKSSIINSGNIFYVGGSGPNNYTSIQDAIDAASDGDTVFVYDDSSPYYENVIVDKSINVIGEDKDSTVINGSKLDSSLNTVNITADNVYIHGFSINDNSGYYYQAAIMIVGDHTTVSNCKIQNNNWIGISLLGSSYSQIFDCELYNNLIAIYLIDSNENEIRDCLCHENSDDILLFQNSHNNQIINCTCIGNGFSGIHIQHSSGNQIVNCTIHNGYEGIGLAYAPNTTMRGNILNNNYENFGIGSSAPSDFYCDIDTSNTINGKPIYYWIDHHDEQIPSDAAFIGLISCSNILVKDLEITNNFQGIVCAGISNCTIENCNFRNNGGHGVFFVSSSNNTIRNCSSRNSFFSGIYLVHLSNSNIISNSTFSNIQVCGMWIEESTSSFISGHVIKNCVKGISLDKSGDSVLRDNDMVNCGLAVDGSSLSDYINDVDTSNKVNGKTIYYYIDENGIMVPSDAGEVILVNCTNCNISNLDLSDGTIGVELAYSSYNVISGNIIDGNSMVAIDLDSSSNNYNAIEGNTIQNNNYGIDVDLSCYNTIQNNIVHDNSVGFSLDSSDSNVVVENDIQNSWNGIFLHKSSNNNVSRNTIQDSGFNGIYLLYSKDNILKENGMVNCGLLVYGISLSDYINDVDTSNKVNGKTIYYYIDENGIMVPSDAGEVILINCAYCNISNLDLSDGTIGVELAYSNYNTISKNTLNNNKFAGIYLESSGDNTVKINTIENNAYGIDLQLSNSNDIKKNKIHKNTYGSFIYLSNSNTISGNNILYNTYGIRFNHPSNSNNIHHNNLIDNGYNAWDENENTNTWDDGKKGNYWGDYTKRYPNANRIWLKGIWNTPYDIPGEDNQDRYPLIKPHISFKEKTVNLTHINFLEKIFDCFPMLKQLLR